ncbi:RNA-metabolising metallo-beta-lactamase [Pandoraea communis]|uniref:RNA-metabolising metallo-beta-lactamase n=1 Tax=Pandoraea communis TaxID=2508297 RepID=A0A5E4YH28_9BURK|nr:MBL fold metallo-hydrolase [Pandoraea communis]VVE48041.1 RNA-metabolising metallo-beta-lactamase [Pandoraea communis]
MQLSFLGAAGTVTGSKTLLSAGGKQVMIDCGAYQGIKNLRARNWAPPAFDVSRLDAVVLTHAHIDHSGYLPVLARYGFKGPVYCTSATRDLCEILLLDSARLEEEQADFLNRHGKSKHRPALPLFTTEDAHRAIALLKPQPFDTPFAIAPELKVTFLHAGHILGAAMAQIVVGDVKILFSGDLGRRDDPIMLPPAIPETPDFLVLESTYGDRLHDRTDPGAQLAEILNRTFKRGGAVIVPAFAVGRVQSLLYWIARLKSAGDIPDVPVYLDSPMAINVTNAYLGHLKDHRLNRAECAEMCGAATFVTSVDESKWLDTRSMPFIVIAGSGMATGGRVLHHLKALAGNWRNTVLFTGFQAPGTRGSTMVNGGCEVKIFGEYVHINAEVVQLDTLSAHADYEETLAWLSRFQKPVRHVFLNHGEPAAADSLRRRIAERLGWPCHVVEFMEEARLDTEAGREGRRPAASEEARGGSRRGNTFVEP